MNIIVAAVTRMSNDKDNDSNETLKKKCTLTSK